MEKGKPDAYEPGCPNEPSTNRRKRIRRINTAIAPGDEKRKEKKRRKKTTTRPDTKIGTK